MTGATFTTSGASKRVFTYNKTVKGTHFNSAIDKNGQDVESIANFFSTDNVEIWEIVVISDISRRYQLYFYSKSSADDATDIDNDAFIDDVEFDLPSNGEQIDSAGPYRLGIRLDQPIKYADQEQKKQLNLGLIPRDGTKTVNDDIVIKIAYIPVYGVG